MPQVYRQKATYACAQPDAGLYCQYLMKAANAETMKAACPRSQSGALDSSTALVAACWGETRRWKKGPVRKGRSGLIESFGSSLRWSGACYRDPVSWFPNNEISEKGICCPLGFRRWTFLLFLCFSLGCLAGSSCFIQSDYFDNMEADSMPTLWISGRPGACW